MHGVRRGGGGRAGYSIIEVVAMLAVLAILAPPLIASAGRLRASFLLGRAQEEAARLLAEARWTAIGAGGATLVLSSTPPRGVVVSAAGDTVAVADLGEGGVSLHLSRGRATARIRYGPLGLGLVSSQTIRFALADEERSLVISSLGRVVRR